MSLQARIDPTTLEIIVKVHDFFKDYKKTMAWLTTKNPMFGNISPLYLINVNRGHRVLQFIENAKEGNLP